jgi:hypothetical protein
MKAGQDMHSPTPEFRDALERTIVREFRSGASIALAVRRRHPFRSAGLIAAGLLLGVGVQFASAQVTEGRQRSELEQAAEVERNLAALRLNLARQAYEQARKSTEVGAVAKQVELEAAAEVRVREVDVARINLELLEIRATSALPRDELWAPLVNGRDFVKERLMMRAVAAQQLLVIAEENAKEARRRYEVGAISQVALNEAQSRAAEVKEDFEHIAQKLTLRQAQMKETLTSDEVTRREQTIELTTQLRRAVRQYREATARYEVAKKRSLSGAADELEMKRAEVEMLESAAAVKRLQILMRAAETGSK